LVCYRCTIHHPLRIQSHSRKSCIFSELFRDLGPKRRQARTPSPMQSRSLHPHIIHINLLLVALLHISSHPSYKYTIISSHLISSQIQQTNPSCNHPPLRQIKPKPFHTTPVLADQVHACFLRIFRRGEQHALVAGGFFVFAHAAGLGF
jgi:hypothetical protein